MGRLIDTDSAINEISRFDGYLDDDMILRLQIAIKRLPTIDAVPVIRCKDCKWWDKVDNIDGVNYGTCERKCTAIRKDAFPNENWYCADGEKVME